MSSPVDICNMALARLGDSANISSIDPPDDSVQANYCSTFYPIALSQALDQHTWRFATKRFALAERTNDAPDEWRYCYAVPSDFINLVRVTAPGIDSIDIDYDIEIAADGQQVLYADINPLALVYVSAAVSSAQLSPAFVAYLSALLAHHLSGPILKGDVGASAANKFLELANSLRAIAIERDTMNSRRPREYVSENTRARN